MSNGWMRIGADSEFGEKIKLVEVGKNKIAVAKTIMRYKELQHEQK